MCVDPNGERINYHHKNSRSGGVLDVDLNASGYTMTNRPIEHIYWPVGGAPKGTYKVFVSYYERHDNSISATDYQLTIKANRQEKSTSGRLEHANRRWELVTQFVVE